MYLLLYLYYKYIVCSMHVNSIKYVTYIKQIHINRQNAYTALKTNIIIRIKYQLTQTSYIMKLMSSPVKPSQLICPSLTLIKSSNTQLLVHTLSDIRCQSFILDLIYNLPSLSNVSL